MYHIYINKRVFIIFSLMLGIILGAKLFPPSLEIAYCITALLVITCISYDGLRAHDQKVISYFLVLPVFFSAFQNIYLGWSAERLSSIELQILLSSNILLVVLGVVLTNLQSKSGNNYMPFIFVLTALLLLSIALFCIYPSNIIAFFSSLRNIIGCIAVYMLATRIGTRADHNTVYKLLNIVCWIVILVGMLELFFMRDLWHRLNIDILWPLKGIRINVSTGVPSNWYASERISTNFIRRMVSTFADPVNLGSYLFAMFVAAWYQGKKVLSLFIVGACVLTVSKGALLGFLIFAVVYVFFKDRTKLFSIIVSGIALIAGITFIRFTKVYSSGSTMFHITQFFSSFQFLKSRPFGMGVGNAGVLAGLTHGLENIGIGETGIGVIAAQLGVLGLILYIIFFCALAKIPLYYHYTENFREKVTYYTLLFSFIANAMFNEVALSINSCAIYFLLLGLLTVNMKEKYRNSTMQKYTV